MNTSIKRIGAVAGAAALLVLIVWYFALFRPQSRDLAAAHKAHAAAEQKVSQLHNQVTQLDSLKSEIPADKAALSVLDAAVPSSPELDSTLIQLHTVATASGVTLSAVSPSAPPAKTASGSSSTASSSSGASGGTASPSGSPSISLTMSASGSYAQIMSFLSGLAGMPRTVVVTSLNIAGTSQLTAQITANIFYTGA
jgi:Tfp pilus assembly protein PilO